MCSARPDDIKAKDRSDERKIDDTGREKAADFSASQVNNPPTGEIVASYSLQNLQAIEPEKILVTLHGPPARIGMLIEH